jgi:integrase
MRGALDTIAGLLTSGRDTAETLDWAALRYQHTAAVRAALLERFAPATANKMLAALRRVLKEAWSLGLMTAEDYRRAADVRGVKGESLQRGRALSAGELGGLVDSCVAEDSVTGARDAALLAVLYGAGLRRAEAVALDLEHYDPVTGALTVRSGKGRKDRIAYTDGGAKLAIDDWIGVRGGTPGALFVRIRKGGRVTRERLSPSGVRHVAVSRSARARVAHFSPHDLRRTFISDLLDAGADIVAVQKLAGHANVQTTAKYDRRGERAKRKAASLLHMPYRSAR